MSLISCLNMISTSLTLLEDVFRMGGKSSFDGLL